MPASHLLRACRALAAGGVIAYPTEGVWGLGCDPRNEDALARLLALKRRNAGKGLILIASDFAQLAPYLAPVPKAKLEVALHSWPGPETWIVPAASGVSPRLRGGHETLAVRVTAHPLVRALCEAFGSALVSTSANLSGRPPARTALGARRRFGAGLDYVLPGALGGASRPTRIRDLMTGNILRA